MFFGAVGQVHVPAMVGGAPGCRASPAATHPRLQRGPAHRPALHQLFMNQLLWPDLSTPQKPGYKTLTAILNSYTYLCRVNLSYLHFFRSVLSAQPFWLVSIASLVICLCLKYFFHFLSANQMNIYVSNLSFAVQDEDLREFFTPYGEVSSARVVIDRDTNRSRGFGFVEMPDTAAANKAIAELNGAMADGRAIRVNEARPREERPARPAYNKSRW